MQTEQLYFEQLAAAYIRGKLKNTDVYDRVPDLFSKPLADLSSEELQAVIHLGREQEIRIHRFKRTMELPRVRKVLGILKGIQPQEMLDIGSGRGAFLWPLLDTFPFLPINTLDILDYRINDIQVVRNGGIEHLSAVHGDVTAMPFADSIFDVVTMLEVLEHIPDTRKALAEVCRVARRMVILSMPSKEDDNPEHIHLFDQQHIKQSFKELGILRVNVEYVPNHMIVVARMEHA